MARKDNLVGEIQRESEFTKLNFGKYKGYYLRDVPLTYLDWACDNLLDEGLRWMCKIERERRTKKRKNRG